MRAQALIELLIITLVITASLLITLLNNDFITNRLRINNDELTLINYLNHTSSVYNEKMLLIISAECSNNSFFSNNSLFFNESISVIESLNGGKPFILFINNTYEHEIYNNKSSVCLKNARLATINFKSKCGEGVIMYGSWSSDDEC